MRRKSFSLVLLLAGSMVLLLLLGTLAMADTPGWYQQTSGTTSPLGSVAAVDSNTAWVSGGACLKTLDGGSTWQPYTNPNPGGGVYISAVDRNTAWAVTPLPILSVYKTTDGGNTWETQLSNDPGGVWMAQLTAVAAVDSDTAWVAGFYYRPDHHINYCFILGTTDGGVTWSSKYYCGNEEVSGSAIVLWDIDAVDSNTVFATGSNVDNAGSTMVKTEDGGASWTKLTTDDLVPLNVSAVNSSNVWIIGMDASSQKVIAKTEDGGGTWTKQYSSSTTTINSICSVDESTAWAVGASTEGSTTNGVILKTTDGTSWKSQDPGIAAPQLYGLDAVDANIAWAVGENGTILHTITGGVIPPPTFTSITPTYGVQNTMVSITNLAGTGFKAGASVRLELGTTVVNATSVNVVSGTQITCQLVLPGTLGKYDVVVKNPDGQEGRLTKGFSVTNVCGGGAAISLSVFGLMMGLLSIAGSTGLRRRFRRKKK